MRVPPGQIPRVRRGPRSVSCGLPILEIDVEKLLLGLLPMAMVIGGLYWTMTMGMREQADADRFTEEWMKRKGHM